MSSTAQVATTAAAAAAATPSPAVVRLHTRLDWETLEQLEALAREGYSLEAEESEFRFHLKGVPIGELLCDAEAVAAAASGYASGEIAVPVTEPVNRNEHEANLKERLVAMLDAHDIKFEADVRGMVSARAIFTARCSADEHTIYDALDDAVRARALSTNPTAQKSYLLLCCVPVKDYPAIERAAQGSSVKVGEWEEADSFPFDLNDLRPTLRETLLARIPSIETLPEFQLFLSSNDLQSVFEGKYDPQKRLPLVDCIAVQEALEACAERLGATRTEKAGSDAPAREVFYALDVFADGSVNITYLGASSSIDDLNDADQAAAIGVSADGDMRVVSLHNLTLTAEELLAKYGADERLLKPHKFKEGEAEDEPDCCDLQEFEAIHIDGAVDDMRAGDEKVVQPQTAEAKDVDGNVEDERGIIPNSIPQFPGEGSPTVTIHRDRHASDTVYLDPRSIRTDGGTQARARLDEATVEDYAEKMRAGEVFPEVVVYFDGTDYWLGDGFHRQAATVRAEFDEIAADVRQGTRRDAVLYAVSANAKHGLRRTDADKRRAVETLLQDAEWSQWSNREIARRCAVSHTIVGNIREELSGHRVQIDAKAVRGGTEYTVSTTNIGKMKKADGDDEVDLAPEIATIPLEERSRAFDDDVQDHSTSPVEDTPATEAKEELHRVTEPASATASAGDISSEPDQPSVVVNDRRRFADEATPAERATAVAAAKPERPAIEDLLKGRALQVAFVWIPGVEGVNASINVVGGDPFKAIRLELKPGELRGLPSDVLQGIIDRLGIKDDAPAAKAKPASKPAAKKTAAKAPAKKTAAAKGNDTVGPAKCANCGSHVKAGRMHVHTAKGTGTARGKCATFTVPIKEDAKQAAAKKAASKKGK